MRILDGRKQGVRIGDVVNRAGSIPPDVENRVREILEEVRLEGDEAVTTLTRRYDCRHIDSLGLRVPRREIERAYRVVSKEFLMALRLAKKQITRFHRRQALPSWTLNRNGVRVGQRVRPLGRVGIYVPGGKAAYPSTVLMNALPARIAGVEEIAMVTPCNREGKIQPEVLVAASECGISDIYRIGGAQAIAALAYGTESIRRVDKITGPGNAYVAAAKRQVFGVVGIDMIAGPTEIVVIADDAANPQFVAADLIAQAEHDERASSICLTTSAAFARKLVGEVAKQLERTRRHTIARQSLAHQGVVVIVRNLSHAAEVANEIAPEHLELMVRHPGKMAEKIHHAGAIFVGTWSTEAMGDYLAGPNHTLPTSGTARFSSPLSVYDFLRHTNIINVSRSGFERLAPSVEILANAEMLDGHAASVRIRRGRHS